MGPALKHSELQGWLFYTTVNSVNSTVLLKQHTGSTLLSSAAGGGKDNSHYLITSWTSLPSARVSGQHLSPTHATTGQMMGSRGQIRQAHIPRLGSPTTLSTGPDPQCCQEEVQDPFSLVFQTVIESIKPVQPFPLCVRWFLELWTSTQIKAKACPCIQTWILVAAKSQTSPLPWLATKSPTSAHSSLFPLFRCASLSPEDMNPSFCLSHTTPYICSPQWCLTAWCLDLLGSLDHSHSRGEFRRCRFSLGQLWVYVCGLWATWH